ncbi:glycosyltransferase family 39 protein [bacterium]|nr:glycosyltransferase family 39 protein [bacterium]
MSNRFRPYTLPLLLAFAILVAYLYLSLQKISLQDPDRDELTTSSVIRKPVPDLIQDRFHAGHPPLYFLALKAWVGLTGHSLTSIWLFSVLLGAAGVVGIWLAAREMGLERWTWAATGLYAIHPTLIQFARYGRPYAGVAALTAFLIFASLRCLRIRSRRSGALLAALGVLGALFNHTLLLFWAGAILATLLIPALRRRSAPGFWSAATVSLAAHFLMILLCRLHRGDHEPLAWLDPTLFESTISLFRVFGGDRITLDHISQNWILPLFLLIGVLYAAWKKPKREESRHKAQSLRWIAFLLLPLPALVLLACLGKPLLVPRYLIVFLPPALLVGASLLKTAPPRRLSAIVLVALLVLTATRSSQVNRWRRSGLREAVAFIEEKYIPGKDLVLLFRPEYAEAFRVFSNRKPVLCLANLKRSSEENWQEFQNAASQRENLWVFSRPAKGHEPEGAEWEGLLNATSEVQYLRKFQVSRLSLQGIAQPIQDGLNTPG